MQSVLIVGSLYIFHGLTFARGYQSPEQTTETKVLDETTQIEAAPRTSATKQSEPESSTTDIPSEAESGLQPSTKTDGGLSMEDVFGQTLSEQDKKNDELSVQDVFGVSAPVEEKPSAPESSADESSSSVKKAFLDKISTRFRILSSFYIDVDRVEKPGTIGRNENRLEFYFTYTPNKHIQIVGDIEAVFLGVSQAQELDDLATQRLLTPFHFESDAAYVAVHDLFPNFDIKVGRQIVVWGTADKFNPTNNINPDDLEDRPLFTEPIANQMVVVDYSPLADRLWFQGVYVPLFFPALLPPSAAKALKDPNTEVPFAFQQDVDELTYLQDTFLPLNPKLIPRVLSRVEQPSLSLTNGQAAFKVGTRIGEVDLSASYYYGRHDIPLPTEVKSRRIAELNQEPPPEDGVYLESDATLVYPRMQVVGLDFTTQLPFLGNMGLWGEAGLFFPETHRMRIELPVPTGVDVTPNDGKANPVKEIEGPTVRKNPYIKATAGLDYTFGKHVYVQAQYLRGFIDEFGSDHIGNYLVGGTELVFFGRHLIFRLFGVVDFPTNNPKGEGASGVVAPALLLTPPWGYVNFEIGSFALLSQMKENTIGELRKSRTKFGQEATGSSIVYIKAIGTF